MAADFVAATLDLSPQQESKMQNFSELPIFSSLKEQSHGTDHSEDRGASCCLSDAGGRA
jgi:hypothetical protein